MKDPYVYENSDCLINKANLKDKMKLEEFENRMTKVAFVSIFKSEIKINNSQDIFIIHKILFQNVFEWAGKPRTIDIYKNEPVLNGMSVEYSPCHKITKDLEFIDKNYFNQEWKALKKEDFIHLFTKMIASIWQVHAFTEGNTRTISAFAFLFLKQQGYLYNAEFIKDKARYFRTALVMASLNKHSEYNHLQNILSDAVNINLVENTNKYSKIKEYNVDSYKYQYHKVKDNQ